MLSNVFGYDKKTVLTSLAQLRSSLHLSSNEDACGYYSLKWLGHISRMNDY